jgi:proline iminopeptidase
LRGISLNRPTDIDWWLHGPRYFFPDTWRRFNEFIPADERGDLLAAYHRRLIDPDPAVHLPAARAWKSYERNCTTLMPLPEHERVLPETARTLAMARIMAHYKINGIFLSENSLIQSVGAIRHLPAVIIQGRYDMICPVAMADVLAGAWPEADFRIIETAGHSAMEPGTTAALVAATQRFKGLNWFSSMA